MHFTKSSAIVSASALSAIKVDKSERAFVLEYRYHSVTLMKYGTSLYLFMLEILALFRHMCKLYSYCIFI